MLLVVLVRMYVQVLPPCLVCRMIRVCSQLEFGIMVRIVPLVRVVSVFACCVCIPCSVTPAVAVAPMACDGSPLSHSVSAMADGV